MINTGHATRKVAAERNLQQAVEVNNRPNHCFLHHRPKLPVAAGARQTQREFNALLVREDS